MYSLYWNTGAVGYDALSRYAGAPTATSNPVGYVSPDGWTHVVYRTGSGRLEELYWYGQDPVRSGNSSPAGSVLAANGDPAPYVNARTLENIVAYRGTDDHLRTLYWTTGAVGHEDLSATRARRTPPASQWRITARTTIRTRSSTAAATATCTSCGGTATRRCRVGT